MATLILATVGTALGGPLGGALGAMLGQAVDGRLLSRTAKGPRLTDLRVQTSRYGDRIPRLYGTMRVAGSVIWATDLKERRHKQGGGKGSPSVTTYSYSSSFAVALSSRRIATVRRIWADGKLLRGEAGDFKSALGAFRLYAGDEDQAPDPLMAADKGVTATPAHRGLAYALFEDLQLADYGNRIPSLTFEVVADAAAPSFAALAADLGDGAIAPTMEGADLTPGGYAADGATVGEALAPMVEGLGLALRPVAAGFVLRDTGGADADRAVPPDYRVASVNGTAEDPPEETRGAAGDVPVRLTAAYYDPARDYQAGSQTAERPGAGRTESTLDLPAVLSAQQARGLAEGRLRALWAGRGTLEVRCDWRALTLAPGAVLQVDGWTGRWRIERSEWEGMAVRLSLVRVPGGGGADRPASSGASVAPVDVPHGPTTLMVVDLPPTGDGAATAPQLVCAAAGVQAGWRAAELFVEDPNSGGLTSFGRTAYPATMGRVVMPPVADAVAALFDDRSAVEVELLQAGMELTGAEDSALAQGANAALLGAELVQFGVAERIGTRLWRLSRLLRGRRGTEWTLGSHDAGEGFLLLDEPCLAAVPEAYRALGSRVRIDAIGIGDPVPVEAEAVVAGQAVLPLSPAHLRIGPEDGAGRAIGWVRRSRAGWRWTDGAEAPLAEEAELYGIALSRNGAVFRTQEVAGCAWLYGAAAMAADRGAGLSGPVTVSVRQIGTFGAGRAAEAAFVL